MTNNVEQVDDFGAETMTIIGRRPERVIEMLRRRYGGTLPSEVEAAVRAEPKYDRLKELLRYAAGLSIEQFTDVLLNHKTVDMVEVFKNKFRANLHERFGEIPQELENYINTETDEMELQLLACHTKWSLESYINALVKEKEQLSKEQQKKYLKNNIYEDKERIQSKFRYFDLVLEMAKECLTQQKLDHLKTSMEAIQKLTTQTLEVVEKLQERVNKLEQLRVLQLMIVFLIWILCRRSRSIQIKRLWQILRIRARRSTKSCRGVVMCRANALDSPFDNFFDDIRSEFGGHRGTPHYLWHRLLALNQSYQTQCQAT